MCIKHVNHNKHNSSVLLSLLTIFIIVNGVHLEIFVHGPVKVLFQTIAKEVEQAFQPIPTLTYNIYLITLKVFFNDRHKSVQLNQQCRIIFFTDE